MANKNSVIVSADYSGVDLTTCTVTFADGSSVVYVTTEDLKSVQQRIKEQMQQFTE